MKSTAIVLAVGSAALATTFAIEAINGFGPLVFMCVFAALIAVRAIDDKPVEKRPATTLKKAA